MKDNRLPEISVDEIMRKIEEEVAKKQTVTHDRASRIVPTPLPPDPGRGVQGEDLLLREKADEGPVREFLWKSGTKYAGVIKKIPVLNEFAERYYWKLSGDSPSPSVPAASHFPTHDAGSDILSANLNYIGFREQLRHEGVKGIIKRLIFQVIGFFAWWQGQINKALHDALARQNKLIAAQEARLAKHEALIADRDKIIEDLENRLSVLNRVEDALYEELTEQRAEIARQREWLARDADSQTDRS